jgi:hypothetical protein
VCVHRSRLRRGSFCESGGGDGEGVGGQRRRRRRRRLTLRPTLARQVQLQRALASQGRRRLNCSQPSHPLLLLLLARFSLCSRLEGLLAAAVDADDADAAAGGDLVIRYDAVYELPG